jgi:catechol 2,3-dioxygenase-like lactoylglutathione lyase family enzyme
MNMTHTRLLVSDFNACYFFYRDIMGFRVLWTDGRGYYADFDAGGHILALFGKSDMAQAIGSEAAIPKSPQQDDVCLIFAVDNVDETYEALVHKGVKPVNTPHDRKEWGIRCFHLRDPGGNLIEINKRI